MKKLLFLILVVYGIFPTTAQRQPLFIEAGESVFAESSLIGAKRSRYVHLNSRSILSPEQEIVLNLFDDTVFEVSVLEVHARPSGESGFVWVGMVTEDAESRVVLVIAHDAIHGQINVVGTGYAIETIEAGLVRITEVDGGEQYRTLQDDGIALPPAPENIPHFYPTNGDNGDVIDVMVVYTPAAALAVTNIDGKIDTMIAVTNQTYAASGVNHRIRLVYHGQVEYSEAPPTGLFSSMQVDLHYLTYRKGEYDQKGYVRDPHGYLDNVHPLRKQYGADLVVLLTDDVPDSATHGECGRSWGLATENLSEFYWMQKHGFSVVNIQCWSPYFTFAHELGHNMGGAHDRNNSLETEPIYHYSHGYQDPGQEFVTIMALPYGGNCPLASQNPGFTLCTPIGRWSSPTQTHNGKPLGSVSADMVQTLNNMAEIVANFRLAVLQPITLIEPPDEVLITDPDVTFQWQEEINASSYTLRIFTMSGYTYNRPLEGICTEGVCSFNPSGDGWKPPYGETLKWRVRAFAGDGRKSQSEARKIMTAFLPDSIALNSPVVGAAVETKNVVMSWQNDSRVDEYWLKLTDPNGIILYKKWHPALCTGETCSLALDLTNFSTKAVQKGVYRWQVKARRDEVSGVTRSINASFMLNLTIPLSTPADGLEITSGSLQTFSWYEHDTLTAYRLKMTSGGVVTTTAWFPATSICSEGICTRIEKVKIAAGSDTVKWQVQGRSAKISGKVKSDKRRLIRS